MWDVQPQLNLNKGHKVNNLNCVVIRCIEMTFYGNSFTAIVSFSRHVAVVSFVSPLDWCEDVYWNSSVYEMVLSTLIA